MMNDMLKAYAKDILQKAMKAGGEAVLEELCENYDADQLDRLVAILTRVRDRKKRTVTVEAKPV